MEKRNGIRHLSFVLKVIGKLIGTNIRDEELKKFKRNLNRWLDEISEKTRGIEAFSFLAFEKAALGKEDSVEKKKVITNRLQDLFDSYIHDLYDTERFSTARSYKCTINSLNQFKKNLIVEDITVPFLQAYEQWMLRQDNSLTTIGVYLRTLRSIFNQAIDLEIISNKKYPFKKYTIPAPRKTKRCLSRDHLKKLAQYTSNSEAVNRARDYWLFSFLSNGMNFKDMAQLKKENYLGTFIEFNRAKTMHTNRSQLTTIKIPLSELSLQIIKKWGNECKGDKEYIFPILDNTMTALQKDVKIDSWIRNTNRRLKVIQQELKFPIPLTTYVARHSFAHSHKNLGSDVEYIREAMGHSSTQTTLNYLGSFAEENLKVYQQKLIDNIFSNSDSV